MEHKADITEAVRYNEEACEDKHHVVGQHRLGEGMMHAKDRELEHKEHPMHQEGMDHMGGSEKKMERRKERYERHTMAEVRKAGEVHKKNLEAKASK